MSRLSAFVVLGCAACGQNPDPTGTSSEARDQSAEQSPSPMTTEIADSAAESSPISATRTDFVVLLERPYCDSGTEVPPSGEVLRSFTFQILDEAGQPLVLESLELEPLAILIIQPAATYLGPMRFQWDGYHYQYDCDLPSCFLPAAPGTYRARFCGYPGQVNADGFCDFESESPECVEQEFELPATAPVGVGIPSAREIEVDTFPCGQWFCFAHEEACGGSLGGFGQCLLLDESCEGCGCYAVGTTPSGYVPSVTDENGITHLSNGDNIVVTACDEDSAGAVYVTFGLRG